MKLFWVERLTKPRGKRLVTVHVFAVIAKTAGKAEEKAKRKMPQDELDGPVVRWTVEEDSEGIFKVRSGQRIGNVS